jgi:N-methylhydantoinase B/oxoprolinase/acetone carboxylase alpha subunit
MFRIVPDLEILLTGLLSQVITEVNSTDRLQTETAEQREPVITTAFQVDREEA